MRRTWYMGRIGPKNHKKYSNLISQYIKLQIAQIQKIFWNKEMSNVVQRTLELTEDNGRIKKRGAISVKRGKK